MKAIMYGAGNIGRGFIGQVFYQSGYETTFIDVNQAFVDKINEDGEYPVYVTRGGKYVKEPVKNVKAISGRDEDAVIAAIADADIMATALGVKVLGFVAPLIAKAVSARAKTGKPLNILICENMIGADKYLREMIGNLLPDSDKAFFEEKIGLVSVSVGRMVPATPEKFASENIISVCVEPYAEIPVDADAFRPVGAPLPEIKGLHAYSPFQYPIEKKLFLHNMGHAVTAYLAYLKGYNFIYEASRDPEIKYFVTRVFAESARALAKKHGASFDEIFAYAEKLISRFENTLLLDTVERVGKDPIRKLAKEDRMGGTFALVKEMGGVPVYTALGIAAGLLFAPESDEAALEVSAYAKANGVREAVKKYCSIEDAADADLIEKFYILLMSRASFAELVDAIAEVVGD